MWDFGGLATGNMARCHTKEDGSSSTGSAAAPAPAQTRALQTSRQRGTLQFETLRRDGQPGLSPSTGRREADRHLQSVSLEKRPLTGTVKGDDVKSQSISALRARALTVVTTRKDYRKDSMKGTVALGELGEGTWSGKRK